MTKTTVLQIVWNLEINCGLQEIMLADIMTVQAYNPPAVVTRNPHVFEIKTPTSTFFVGEDPTRGKIDQAEGPVVNSAGKTRYWSIFTAWKVTCWLPLYFGQMA